MRQPVDKITHDSALLAIIIRSDYRSEGIEFFTPDDFSKNISTLLCENPLF